MEDRRSSSRVSMVSLVVAAVVVLTSSSCTESYAFGPSLHPRSFSSESSRKIRFTSPAKRTAGRSKDGSAVTLYLFPTPPSVSAANHLRKRSGSIDETTPSSSSPRKSKTSLPAMSTSVLSPSDTLPSFHTAHGLLSPEVVMRIANTVDLEENGSALHKFLKLYKSRGPMACLSMLSDPYVLPELTRAMREVA